MFPAFSILRKLLVASYPAFPAIAPTPPTTTRKVLGEDGASGRSVETLGLLALCSYYTIFCIALPEGSGGSGYLNIIFLYIFLFYFL